MKSKRRNQRRNQRINKTIRIQKSGGLFSKKEEIKTEGKEKKDPYEDIKKSIIDRYLIYEKDVNNIVFSKFTRQLRTEKEMIHYLFKSKNEIDKKEILPITEIYDTENNKFTFGEDIFLIFGGLVNPTSVCVKNKIYLIGGYDYLDDYNKMYIYDINNENEPKFKWYSGKSTKNKYKTPKAVEIDNKIYLFGVLKEELEELIEVDEQLYCNQCNNELFSGKLDSNPNKYVKCKETCEETFGIMKDNTVEIEDSFKNKVVNSINNMESDILAASIIMSGGNKNKISCEIYDIKNNKWTIGKSMRYPREHMCVVSKDKKIYLIGGSYDYLATNKVEIYDTEKDEYTEGQSMNMNRSGASACLIDNKIYVFGGTDNKNDLFCSEYFDFEKNKWLKGPDIKDKQTRCYHSCEVIGDNIYLINGYNGTCNSKECLMNYDSEKDKKKEELKEYYEKNPKKFENLKGVIESKYGKISRSKAREIIIENDIRKILNKISNKSKLYGKDVNTILIYNIKTKEWKTHNSNISREKISTCVYKNKIYILGGHTGRKRLGPKIYDGSYKIPHALGEYMYRKENYLNLSSEPDPDNKNLNIIKIIDENDKLFSESVKKIESSIQGNKYYIDSLVCFNERWGKMNEEQQKSAELLGYNEEYWPFPPQITSYQEYYSEQRMILKYKSDIELFNNSKPPNPSSKDLNERKKQIEELHSFNKKKEKFMNDIPYDIMFKIKCQFPEIIKQTNELIKELKDNFEKGDDSNIDVGNLFGDDEDQYGGGTYDSYIKYLNDKLLNEPDNEELNALIIFYTNQKDSDDYLENLKKEKISKLWRKVNEIEVSKSIIDNIEDEEDPVKQKNLLIDLFKEDYIKNKKLREMNELKKKISIHSYKWEKLDDKYKNAWKNLGLDEWQWPPGNDNNFKSKNQKIDSDLTNKLKQEFFFLANPKKWKDSAVMQAIPMAIMGGVVGAGFMNHGALGAIMTTDGDAAAVGPIAALIPGLASGGALLTIASIPLSMGVMMSSKMGIEKFGNYIGNKLVAEGSWLDKQTEKNTATDIENKKKGEQIVGASATMWILGFNLFLLPAITGDITAMVTDDDGNFTVENIIDEFKDTDDNDQIQLVDDIYNTVEQTGEIFKTIFGDTDGDWIPNILDTDADGDGVSNAQEAALGTDSLHADDGLSEDLQDKFGDEIDDDDISDAAESDWIETYRDSDGDGVSNAQEEALGTNVNEADDFSDIAGDDGELSQEEINNAIESHVKDDALQTYNEYMKCIDDGLDSLCDRQEEAWNQAKETLREINIDNPEETISNMDDAYDVGFW
jgi:hypothetical protein